MESALTLQSVQKENFYWQILGQIVFLFGVRVDFALEKWLSNRDILYIKLFRRPK